MDAIDRQADTPLCKLEITVEEKIDWHAWTAWKPWKLIFKATVRVGDLKVHTLDIPVDSAKAVVELSCMGDWSRYPTNDLDLFLSGLAGESITAATVSCPEGAVIDTPTGGPWTIEVEAYLIYAPRELYRIRATTNPWVKCCSTPDSTRFSFLVDRMTQRHISGFYAAELCSVMQVQERLKELGLKLPPVQKPIASYVPAVKVGALVFSSGQGPLVDGKTKYVGRLGGELTLDQGYEAARICALNCLAAIKAETRSLDDVERVVKVLGFVSSAEGFTQQSQVVNGASDLLVKIFGERGRHARSSIGVNVLPMNIPVEVEMIVKLKKGTLSE